MSSIREQVLEKLKSDFAAISTAGGYNFDIVTATRAYVPWSEVNEFPTVLVLAGDETVESRVQNLTNPRVMVRFEFGIVAYVQADTDTDLSGTLSKAEESMVEDLKRCLAADPTLGALVEEAVWDRIISVAKIERNVVIVEMQGHATFSHDEDSP